MNLPFQLLGDRVLIQLDELPDHSVTSSGIHVPHFLNIETDGGRPDVKVSNLKHVAKGTIISISPLASQKLADQQSPLQEGDRIFVVSSAVSPSYQFFPDRDKLDKDFTGIIGVPHPLIEAKLTSNV